MSSTCAKKLILLDEEDDLKGVFIIETLVDEHMKSLIGPKLDDYYEGLDEMDAYIREFSTPYMGGEGYPFFEPPWFFVVACGSH